MRRPGMATGRGPHHPDRPAGYEFWQNYRADFWPGPQLGWVTQEPETGEPLNRLLFSESGEQDLWTFRRIRYCGHYTDDVSDVTLVNWPQVDYWLTPLIGVPEQERRSSLARRGSCHSALCTGCRQRHRALTAEPAIRASAVPGSAGYPRRSGSGGVRSGKPPDRPHELTVGGKPTLVLSTLGRARIARRPSRTRSASAATGLTYIRARPGAVSGHRDLPVSDPLGAPRRLDNLLAAGKCAQVSPTSPMVLPAPPGGMERRRGGGRFGRVLP